MAFERSLCASSAAADRSDTRRLTSARVSLGGFGATFGIDV
eukprot:CAMPEP_0181171724 /NCGR_PEP_ID=MMETSP1096-20121128/2067_1 /TAXON_ID=156174 ORGANISM="Chrysochromulina ericina, Strain CCMP281" /NCGR_SAMPLE_ID=MMETSP1096 /ASSEMBLY_ACC=CAM_ASM_000453 /LENGTH=40 /DNA_ID= /DNA_START= /DNA_END= /DNA_ORIENTATION=